MARLRELREQYGYTQDFVAETIGVSRSTYCRYELDFRQIKAPELMALSKLYNVSIDYLLGLSDTAIWDKKIDLVDSQVDTSTNFNDSLLSEADQKSIEQYIDTAISRALGKLGLSADSLPSQPDHTDPEHPRPAS